MRKKKAILDIEEVHTSVLKKDKATAVNLINHLESLMKQTPHVISANREIIMMIDLELKRRAGKKCGEPKKRGRSKSKS